MAPNSSAGSRATNEPKFGIIHYVSPVKFSWRGEIRKRFTDFIVNEVRKDGVVLHLTDYDVVEEQKKPTTASPDVDSATGNEDANVTAPPAVQPNEPEIPQIPQEDVAILEQILGNPTTTALTELYTRGAKGDNGGGPASNKITFPPISDKTQRGLVHREIRRIFGGQFETQADDSGIITATSTARPNRRKRGNASRGASGDARGGGRGRGSNRSFDQLGGDYLHFTLYKENKDTMEALSHIARMLKIRPSSFSFAGTKDRRAATTQRVCALRVRQESLEWLNSRPTGYKTGDYKYQPHQINLGDHGGNEFVIVVKDCELQGAEGCSVAQKVQMLQQSVSLGLANIKDNGFLNYFGLQRFGTHAIGTQEVGTMILTENFEKAVDALLHVEPDVAAHAFSETDSEASHNKDEYARARAISVWRSSGDGSAALKHMPRRFGAESSIIQHLGKNEATRRDFCGALLTITRGMRQMYIHAYQSRVWNFVASKRWERYGNKVVKGDLILANPNNTAGDLDEDVDEYPASGSADSFERARALTAEEADSGKYTIFDVMLPLPGFDVLYPDNDIGAFYAELMATPEYGGLDPHNMRRRQREFSLSGSYRKLMARFVGEASGEARAYRDDNEQMHPTDLDLIEKRKAAEKKDVVAKQGEEKRQREPENEPTSSESRTGDTWVAPATHGTSKRLKTTQNSPSGGTTDGSSSVLPNHQKTTDILGQDKPSDDAVDTASRGNDIVSTKPIRQPTIPDQSGSRGFKNSTQPHPSNNTAMRRNSISTAPTAGEMTEDMKLAVILRFQLRSSNYATMFLRELMGAMDPDASSEVPTSQ